MPKAPPRLDPDDPVQGLALDMRALRLRAGNPPLAELARAMSCSHSTVSAYLNGHRVPPPDQVRMFVLACHGDMASWLSKLEGVHAQLSVRLATVAEDRALDTPAPRGHAPRHGQAPGEAGTPPAGAAAGAEPGVMTVRPSTLAEARDLEVSLRSRRPLIIDLTANAGDDARRIGDYAAGLASGARWTVERTVGRVFVLLPPDALAGLRDEALNDAYRLGAGLPVTSRQLPPAPRREHTVKMPAIRVAGVGGGGINVAGQVAGRSDVQVLAIDTDPLALVTDKADVQLELRVPQPVDPWRWDVAAAAAHKHRDQLEQALADAALVFVVAGEGGSTGTAAAPVVASAARSAGAITVGVVSRPFGFEGPHKAAVAAQGIGKLRGEVDALLVIPQDRVLHSGKHSLTVADSFRLADAALVEGLRCIIDPVTVPGIISLDFADIRRALSGGGLALTGTGTARGTDRAVTAASAAISSMLAETSGMEARSMLLSIRGGPDLSLGEVDEAARIASGWAVPDVELTFGAHVEEGMGDAIQVTIIAAGLTR